MGGSSSKQYNSNGKTESNSNGKKEVNSIKNDNDVKHVRNLILKGMFVAQMKIPLTQVEIHTAETNFKFVDDQIPNLKPPGLNNNEYGIIFVSKKNVEEPKERNGRMDIFGRISKEFPKNDGRVQEQIAYILYKINGIINIKKSKDTNFGNDILQISSSQCYVLQITPEMLDNLRNKKNPLFNARFINKTNSENIIQHFISTEKWYYVFHNIDQFNSLPLPIEKREFDKIYVRIPFNEARFK